MPPPRGTPALLALLCLCGVAHAQRFELPPRQYEHFPVDGDLQQILQARLAALGNPSSAVAGLLEKLKQHAKNIPWLDKDIQGLDAADPRTPQKLQELLGKAQGLAKGLKIDPGQLKQIQETIQQQLPDLKRPPEVPKGDGPAARPDPDLPKLPDQPAGQPEPRGPRAEDQLSRWAEDLMQRLATTRLGERLSESPEWQRALRGLREGMSGGKFDLPGVSPDQFKMPLEFTTSLPGLDNLKIPEFSLSRLRWPEINLRLPRLGALGGGGPVAPGGGLGSVAQGALWAALAILLGVVVWRALRRGGWRRRAEATSTDPDARPIAPESVTSAGDLVAAFERLALLRLGEAARTSNHRDIADELGADSFEARAAADGLATLYEQARYDPDAAALDGPQVAAARRHLSQLAGAGSS